MSSEVALKHFLALSGVSEPGPDGDDAFPVLLLKISISSRSTAEGAWQRC